MIFHLPLLSSIFVFTLQAYFGLTYRVRATVVTAILFTAAYFGFLINHEWVFIQNIFLIQFWGIALVTFLQRNSWKRVPEV